MEIEKNSRCVKFILPNGKYVDILQEVYDEIKKWLQVDQTLPESGGYIVGYKHKISGNISLEAVSHPYKGDIKNAVRFGIRDSMHRLFLSKKEQEKSFYMGVWHTHPQEVPIPSLIDWNDWNETLKVDKSSCEYIFFVIFGTKEYRIWVGDCETKEIKEIYECDRKDDLYEI